MGRFVKNGKKLNLTTILKVHLRVDEGSGNGEQYTDCSEVRGVFFVFFKITI